MKSTIKSILVRFPNGTVKHWEVGRVSDDFMVTNIFWEEGFPVIQFGTKSQLVIGQFVTVSQLFEI